MCWCIDCRYLTRKYGTYNEHETISFTICLFFFPFCWNVQHTAHIQRIRSHIMRSCGRPSLQICISNAIIRYHVVSFWLFNFIYIFFICFCCLPRAVVAILCTHRTHAHPLWSFDLAPIEINVMLDTDWMIHSICFVACCCRTKRKLLSIYAQIEF